MGINRGKKFEGVIREAFEKIPEVSIDRVHDQTTKYKGSKNICDFIVYKEPYEYYIECKSIRGNTFPLANITDTQRLGLLRKSIIEGVFAGVICWWVDKDTTLFIPIDVIQNYRQVGIKSIRWDDSDKRLIPIYGRKRRVFFDYDMSQFFVDIKKKQRW